MTAQNTSNPFVGLRAFESDEDFLFFGREQQALELLQRLHQHHFVAVIGSSGSGKSSLIKAGLIPSLQAGYLVSDRDRWVIASMKPGQEPIYNFAEAVVKALTLADGKLTATTLIEKIKEEGAHAILDLLQPLWGGRTNFLLLVDQFEELFRFSMNQKEVEKRDEATDFVNILLELSARTDLPVYVVLTMRSDFIGDCTRFYGLPEALNQSQYLVPRLSRTQLKTIIEGPVKLFKGNINPVLTARLLNDAQVVKDELPLLQHALMRMWDYELHVDKNGELDARDYERIGGIEKALSKHADEALAGMSEADLLLTKRIFQALTSIDENGRKVRRPVPLSELEAITGANKEQLLAIINRFIEDNRSFLVLNKSSDGKDWLIDISHESLIRQWTTLSDWVDEESESRKTFLRLTESAKLYSEKKKDLLMGNELQQVLQWYYSFKPTPKWAQQYSPEYNENIHYLKQSELGAKRKKADRKKFLAGITIGLAGVIFVFSFLYIKAENATKDALAQKGNSIQLVKNYRNNSKTARAEGNLLNALYYTAEALDKIEDMDLKQNCLLDAEAYLPQTCLKAIISHNKSVNTAIFSPDGTKILTASKDSTACIWDAGTGTQIGSSLVHDNGVNNAVFSPNGKQILTAGSDKVARLWDAETGKQIGPDLKHDSGVNSAVFSPNGKQILTAGNDKTARLWDAETGKQIGPDLKHDSGVNSAVFSPDGTRILTASRDYVARIWDVGTGKKIGTNMKHAAGVNTAVFSPDGAEILTASNDSTAGIWSARTGKKIGANMKHAKGINSAVFSPDGTKILTASTDKTAKLWKAQTHEQIGTDLKHDFEVYTAVFSPDGTSILTASGDKTAQLWDAQTQRQIGSALKHDNSVNSAVFSSDGKRILTAGSDGTARLWDVQRRDQTGWLFCYDFVANSAVFSPNGKEILTTSFDKSARLWNVETSRQIGVGMNHSRSVHKAIFSPDGTKILTASADSSARLWDAQTQKQMGRALKHDDYIYSVAFSPDGKQILTTARNATNQFWDARTGNKIGILDCYDAVYNAVFSPTGKQILTAGNDKTARLWDAETGKQIGYEMNHSGSVYYAVFNFNGKQILTASQDETVQIWDAHTQKQIGATMKHPGEVISASFSPDGKRIVTLMENNTVQVWDAQTQRQIGSAMIGRNDEFISAVFSPNGKQILTAGLNGTRLWNIEGDLDLPISLFKVQAQATTGVQLNLETSDTECIPPEEWKKLKQKYFSQAREHYKACRYRQYNLWRRFFPDEAKKIYLAEVNFKHSPADSALILNSEGLRYNRIHDFETAEEVYLAALAIYERLAKTNPKTYEPGVAITQRNLGTLYLAVKNYSLSEKLLVESLHTQEKWMKVNSKVYTGEAIQTSEAILDVYSSMLISLKFDFFQQFNFNTIKDNLHNLLTANSELRSKLGSFYGECSYYLLFASKFKESEESAAKGLKLDSTQLWIKTNLAHSILFQGRYTDALKVYFELKPLKDDEGKSYASACLEDLDQLEKQRVTSKNVNKIREFLKGSKEKHN